MDIFNISSISTLTTLTNNPSMTAPKQHKQRYYYIFWGLATLCVVIGQVNIISTYNRLSDNLELLLIENIKVNKAPN